MAKRILKDIIRDIFIQAKRSPIWKRFERLPFLLRISCGIFFLLFGLLGILTPIPLGAIFFTIGLALLFGLKRTQIYIFSFIHFTRLHILYGKVYVWWKKRKTP